MPATPEQLKHLIPWKPGESGNPSGRPKGTVGMAERIRQRTNNGELMVNVCLEVMETGSKRDKLEAARLLWDRGFGKAIETVQTVEGSVAAQALCAEITSDDLVSLARQIVVPIKPTVSDPVAPATRAA